LEKATKGINVVLQLHNQACHVLLSFQGEDRIERRERVLELFPDHEYNYELRESPKFANIWRGFHNNQNYSLLDLTTANYDIFTLVEVYILSIYHTLMSHWDTGKMKRIDKK
jgi:hypothetical protein